MPVTHVRYRPNRQSFGEMMMSEQTRHPANEAATEIAALATANQRISKDAYEVNTAVPPVVIDGNPRAVAHVEGNDRLHAVEEFGSGTRSEGSTAGQPRPQGGYSQPNRTLARAAASILPPSEVKPA